MSKIDEQIKDTIEMIEMKMIASLDETPVGINKPSNIMEVEIKKLIDSINDKKHCMPDNVNTKEEHEEYLKAIGHEKYVKKLQHHYDTTVGLWAFDCDPKELLHKFNNSQSDANPLELGDFEELLEYWERFCNNENIGKSPFFQIK